MDPDHKRKDEPRKVTRTSPKSDHDRDPALVEPLFSLEPRTSTN
jgi:hypothetical protein